jgi:hypothetical protein
VALHLFLVGLTMTLLWWPLYVFLVLLYWDGGISGVAHGFALASPVAVALLFVAALPVRRVVPACASAGGRLVWAVVVFVLGTPGVLVFGFSYYSDQGLGLLGVGLLYAMIAAFFVPDRQIRVGVGAVLAGVVAFGGLIAMA